MEGSESQLERERVVPGRFEGVVLMGHWIEGEEVPHSPQQTGLQEVWETSVQNLALVLLQGSGHF